MQILHKNRILISLVALLAVVFAVGMVFDYKVPEIQASATDNVSGYAWSENIGWISFNCTNETPPCSGTNYGVNIDQFTGNFSGYAWSENIGWIDFAPAGPYPAAPNNAAKLGSDGLVTGWARALSADGLGWDGWIKMNPSGGVKLNAAKNGLEGYAWGSDVVGWIDFSPVFGGVNYSGIEIPPPGECNDGVDNADADILIDMADPGCTSTADTSEDQAPNFTVNSSNGIKADMLEGTAVTSTETTINITMIDTGDPVFSGPVTLSVDSSDLPGSTYNWSSTTINSPYGGSVSVTFSVNVPAGTPDNSYTIRIRASGGGINSYVNIPLNSNTIKPKFEEL